MRRVLWALPIGIAVGLILVASSLSVAVPGWGLLWHTECELGPPTGNVTAWLPSALVAAPYHGFESGRVELWWMASGLTYTFSQPTSVTDGNVSAYYVFYVNLTIYQTANRSVAGPGWNGRCSSGLEASGSLNPPEGARSGGTTWWSLNSSELSSDASLPGHLNASALCAAVENMSNKSCAVSAEFDMDYRTSSGEIDTCGLNSAAVLRTHTTKWPVQIPYSLHGTNYLVPLIPGVVSPSAWTGGTLVWYNYTFPANAGIWQYENLSQQSTTGGGFVFAYTACP